MKKLALRAYFALALAAVLAIGAFAFTISYFVKADDWVMFSGSPHVYSGANLSVGYVDDRDGTRLLDATDGRTYSDDAQTRAATMHLLGDRYGYIYAPLLGNFADKMIGYDKINGLYTLREEYSTAQLSISAEVQKAALEALNAGEAALYRVNTALGSKAGKALDRETRTKIKEAERTLERVLKHKKADKLTPVDVNAINTAREALSAVAAPLVARWESEKA